MTDEDETLGAAFTAALRALVSDVEPTDRLRDWVETELRSQPPKPTEPKRRSTRRRLLGILTPTVNRRLRSPLTAAVSLVALGAGVLAFMVPFGVSVGTHAAWARTVLTRASAFIRSRARGPLYTDVTTITRGGALARRTSISRTVTWQLGADVASTTRYLYPRRAEIEESVFRGRRVAVFDPATNTIRESLNPRGGSMTYAPILQALTRLDPGQVQRLQLGRHLAAGPAAGPSVVSKVMIILMRSSGTRAVRTRQRGVRAIRLSNRAWAGVIYLSPMTYAPREIYWTDVPGNASHGSQTLIINAYREVKPSKFPQNIFDLTRRHPAAKIEHTS
jgi:hypothetical protein